jgi:hypothetical protein
MGGNRVEDGDGRALRQPGGNWSPAEPEVCSLLARAEVEKVQLVPSGSNYVFAMFLKDDAAGPGVAIYKPRRGEAPLHDFPDGTLYRRERATYLVSEALGWRIVPPTVIRDGPHGVGTAQLYIEHRPRASYFTMKGVRDNDLRRMALFDAVINNADRKGGHCLEAMDGHIWGIDHGLTFHHQRKLRTVIWDYAGEPIDEALLAEVERLLGDLEDGARGLAELRDLLHERELRALCERIERLLEERVYPLPPPWRPVPWPPL